MLRNITRAGFAGRVPLQHKSSISLLNNLNKRSFCTIPPIEDEEKRWRDKKAHKRRKRFRRWTFALLAGSAITAFAIYELQPNGTFGPKVSKWVHYLPLRLTSHLWGQLTTIETPPWLNQRLLKLYAYVYGCNLDEMEKPLESYKSIQQFFSRRLKPGARTFVPTGIASPVDGTVMTIHKVENQSDHVDQIKGITYSMKGFLGEQVNPVWDHTDLYHCIIYLAPGDYHGIHSPVDWEMNRRRYVAGHLFPVAPVVVKKLESLFGMNERVVLSGNWEHGHFSLSAVGATNVGSISLAHEPKFRSNTRKSKIGTQELVSFIEPLNTKRGEEVAFFHMGSTIVMVFESPPLEFDVQPGDKVKMGQSIAKFIEQSEQ